MQLTNEQIGMVIGALNTKHNAYIEYRGSLNTLSFDKEIGMLEALIDAFMTCVEVEVK